MIKFNPFSRFQRFAIQTIDVPAEGLAAFHDESTLELLKTSPPKRTFKVRPLVIVLAVLVIIESVPAGLWVYQTFRRAVIAAPVAAPVAAPADAPVTAIAPAKPEPAAARVTEAPVVARETTRAGRSAATATSKPANAVPPGQLGGLIAIAAPVPMRIYSRGRIVGTTEAETIMLPVGNHDLSFVSEETGYSARRTVNVQAGQTARIQLDSPSGTVNVNASPWAEVWIDGKRIGDTPIGNLLLPIGVREFVFRHPELGERRKTALITLKDPVRVSIDMRTK